ncbi:glycosyltransferase family 4 protein [Candidatus Woesebacteria bacterium]|nr:glycosyltransferase family 4 protein [Candidatus Woesebacteria bacterium]
MKIAFLNIYQSEVSRGAEVFATEVSKRLQKNHQVTIISGRKKAQTRWPILWRLYLDLDGLSIMFFTLRHVITLIKGNYDIVIPMNGGWQSAIVRLFTWVTGKKMIIVGQSGIGWDDRINLLCSPDYFVGISSDATKWAKKVCPWVRSTYIPNGVDTTLFTRVGKTFRHRLTKPVVLCVAALTESKQIEKTIEAMVHVPHASLLIVGVGHLKERLHSLGVQKLHDRFMIMSAPHSEMPEIYRSADCFTLCSVYSEAFGNVYVEALASNLPVVATNDDKRKEIIGEAGLFVNPDDTAEYATAITTCLSRRWGITPEKQSRMFDWSIISSSYDRLFTSLL